MKKIIIANHKMFLSQDESVAFERQIKNINFNNIDLIVCPNFLNLRNFENYSLGAQDCSTETEGNHTGEVSAYHLSLIGIRYVICGHMEREGYEQASFVNMKIKQVLRNCMTPIVCIGETKCDNQMHRTSVVLKKQLITYLKDVILSNSQQIIIAYEPEWSVGSGEVLSAKEIEDATIYIKKVMQQLNISNYKVIYGGSVNCYNALEIIKGCDGLMLGKSSTNYDEFKSIIESVKSV